MFFSSFVYVALVTKKVFLIELNNSWKFLKNKDKIKCPDQYTLK